MKIPRGSYVQSPKGLVHKSVVNSDGTWKPLCHRVLYRAHKWKTIEYWEVNVDDVCNVCFPSTRSRRHQLGRREL